MNVRSFLDTNVLVYAFDRSSPEKARVAQQLIADGAAEKQAVISYQVVQEFINVAVRSFRIVVPRSDLEAFLLAALFPLMTVSSSPSLMLDALRLQAAHELAWYDSLIVAAALQDRCKILYSEDLQHGQRFGDLIVENPFL